MAEAAEPSELAGPAGQADHAGSPKLESSDPPASSEPAESSGSPGDSEIGSAASSDDEHECSGRLLGDRYQLGACMGGGGMADVYRATDIRLHRPVAVKVFRSSADRAGRRRFEDEAKLLARLNHPGLVPVHDASSYGDRPYLVMQLVEGETLETLIDREPLEPHRIAEIGQRLSEVLAYVHENGIVHRDVKPSNVLIAEDDRVFLADFGVSRLVDAVGQMTSSGIIMGTTNYMSPEQVRDSNIGFATDVYSLGLVLLECATGEQEYPGRGAESAVARLSRHPLVPEELPERLAGILRAMTVDEPHWRPSAHRCATALGGQSELSAPVTSTPGASSASPEAASVTSTSVAATSVAGQQGSSSEVPRRRSYGSTAGIVAAAGAVVVVAAFALVWLLLPSAPGNPAPLLPPVKGPAGAERLPDDLANLERLVQQ